MRRLTVLTGGTIFWRLQESGQPQHPLRAFPGWALCNPLYAGSHVPFGEPTILGKIGGETVLTTRTLSLAASDNQSNDFDIASFEEMLRRLRYVSRQFSLPRTCFASSTAVETSDPVKLQATPKGGQTKVRRHIMATALTDQHLELVAELSSDYSIPVHADVLLDALEAQAQNDFRKALLYGTIAVEAFAAQELEAAAVTNVGLADVRHRITSHQVDANTTVKKDPISNLLLYGDNFSRLLHEAPLYILGRSLLVDRPDTYREALRLYATRNKIAHLGVQPVDDKYFPATAEGSTEGLGVAVEAIRWFGDAGPYVIPDLSFISLDRDDSVGESSTLAQPQGTQGA